MTDDNQSFLAHRGFDGRPQATRTLLSAAGDEAADRDRFRWDDIELFEFSDPDDYDPNAQGSAFEHLPEADGGLLPFIPPMDAVRPTKPLPSTEPQGARGTSRTISAKQAANVLHALYFANELGMIMNIDLILTFGDLGCRTDEECVHAFSRFLDRYRAWASQVECPAAYWYCWERAKERGLHVHLQMYVKVELQKRFREWVYATAESLPKSGQSSGRPFLRTRRGATLANQWAATRYNLKGIDPIVVIRCNGEWFSFRDIHVRLRDTGLVPCKRVGVAKMLGWEARKRAGYRLVSWDEGDPFKAVWTDEGVRRWESKAPERMIKAMGLGGGVI